MRVQLKRSKMLSNGKALEPNAENMEQGELALNYNSKDPALFIKQSDNSVVRVGDILRNLEETTLNAETDFVIIQRDDKFYKVKASDLIG